MCLITSIGIECIDDMNVFFDIFRLGTYFMSELKNKDPGITISDFRTYSGYSESSRHHGLVVFLLQAGSLG